MDFTMNLTFLQRTMKSSFTLMFSKPLLKINTNDNPEFEIIMDVVIKIKE